MILIEKKLSTYSFVSDDPLVYEPVYYEMLVGKEYYALLTILFSICHVTIHWTIIYLTWWLPCRV